MVTGDVPAILRRARNQAILMLVLSAVGLWFTESSIAWAMLGANATVWLVRVWYFQSQLYEHSLVFDHRRDL